MSLWVPNSGSKRKDKVNDNSSVTLGKLEWVRVERKEPIARVTTLYSGRAGRYPIMWASLYYLLRFDIFEHCWVSGHQIWSCILVLVWLVNWKDPYLIMCSYLPILCVCVCSVVCDPLWVSWAVAHQAPLSMGCPRQEYWSGFPFPPPGDLLDPENEPTSLASPALADKSLYHWATWEAHLPILHMWELRPSAINMSLSTVTQ